VAVHYACRGYSTDIIFAEFFAGGGNKKITKTLQVFVIF
jgi:hypothetical protein